jgi:hypothetical protein
MGLEALHQRHVAGLLAAGSSRRNALTLEECLQTDASTLTTFLNHHPDNTTLAEKQMIRLAVYVLKTPTLPEHADAATHNATRGLVSALKAYSIGPPPSMRERSSLIDNRAQVLENALNLLEPHVFDPLKNFILPYLSNFVSFIQRIIKMADDTMNSVHAIVGPINKLLDIGAQDNSQHAACRTLVSPIETAMNTALAA